MGRHWCSLYRAIDRVGNLIEALVSEMRDMRTVPKRAIHEICGPAVAHCTSRYKNNRIERDHRDIEQETTAPAQRRVHHLAVLAMLGISPASRYRRHMRARRKL